MMATEPDLSALREDGDTVELDDGCTLRLSVEPDDIDPFREWECYGRVAPVERDRYGDQAERPDGYNGNAEILSYGHGSVWWQPSPDGPKRGTPEFKRERSHVRDLLEYGMCGLVLELCNGTDAYGRPVVVRTASLWAIEPFPEHEYVTTILRDLWSEIETEESK